MFSADVKSGHAMRHSRQVTGCLTANVAPFRQSPSALPSERPGYTPAVHLQDSQTKMHSNVTGLCDRAGSKFSWMRTCARLNKRLVAEEPPRELHSVALSACSVLKPIISNGIS